MKKFLVILLTLLIFPSAAFSEWKQFVLASGAAANGVNGVVRVNESSQKTFYITSTGVSSGATVLIQASANAANWATIATIDVTSNGTAEVAISGLLHNYMRTEITDYSDGTYHIVIGVN